MTIRIFIEDGASIEIRSNKDEQLVPLKVKETFDERLKRAREAEKEAVEALQGAKEEIRAIEKEAEIAAQKEKAAEREIATKEQDANAKSESEEAAKAAEEARVAQEGDKADDPLYLARETFKSSVRLYLCAARNKRAIANINPVNLVLENYLQTWIKDMSCYREGRRFPKDYEVNELKRAFDTLDNAMKSVVSSTTSYVYASQIDGDHEKTMASYKEVESCLNWGLQNVCKLLSKETTRDI